MIFGNKDWINMYVRQSELETSGSREVRVRLDLYPFEISIKRKYIILIYGINHIDYFLLKWLSLIYWLSSFLAYRQNDFLDHMHYKIPGVTRYIRLTGHKWSVTVPLNTSHYGSRTGLLEKPLNFSNWEDHVIIATQHVDGSCLMS